MNVAVLTVALPIIGAVAIGLLAEDDHVARVIALVASLATLVAAIAMAINFDPAGPTFQMVAVYDWIPAIGASFAFGIDGIALVLVTLTAFLTPIMILASWHVTDRVKGYMSSFLLLEGAVIGVFSTTDLLLFYVFFEFTLVPMYLIIGMWGGVYRRYAAIKFFLYTLFGGLLMLVAILYLYAAAGADSFAFADVLANASLDLAQQRWLFLAFFAAFAVKVPLFPVHTWLPDAHTEAPTAGSVFLAAILLKLGAFGFLRYSLPLFPEATREFALGTGTGFFSVPWILVLSVVGILYGALVSLVQKDIKRLVAYSSVSHMGFVVLGIFALNTTAASAGVVQMINHGLSTGALFLLIGFLYERRHTREIAAFGGLARQVPVLAGLWLLVSLSSLALPGLNGFVGEFPILLGTFQVHRAAAVLGSFGAVLAALYLLWAYQRMFHGPVEGAANAGTVDLNRLEIGIMVPIVALIVAIGIYPDPLYDVVEPAVENVLTNVSQVAPAGDAVEPAPLPAGGQP